MTNPLGTGLACALACAPAGAEATTIKPVRLARMTVDLLKGRQHPQLDHGFKRGAFHLDLLREVTDGPAPVIVSVLGSGWSPNACCRI